MHSQPKQTRLDAHEAKVSQEIQSQGLENSSISLQAPLSSPHPPWQTQRHVLSRTSYKPRRRCPSSPSSLCLLLLSSPQARNPACPLRTTGSSRKFELRERFVGSPNATDTRYADQIAVSDYAKAAAPLFAVPSLYASADPER